MLTNKEAVDYIKEWLKDEYALNSKDRIVLTMAIDALKQTAWIPVGEKSPLMNQKVIVSVTDEYETYSDTDAWTGEYFWGYADEVTAWMPLPEPYKGGKE